MRTSGNSSKNVSGSRFCDSGARLCESGTPFGDSRARLCEQLDANHDTESKYLIWTDDARGGEWIARIERSDA